MQVLMPSLVFILMIYLLSWKSQPSSTLYDLKQVRKFRLPSPRPTLNNVAIRFAANKNTCNDLNCSLISLSRA